MLSRDALVRLALLVLFALACLVALFHLAHVAFAADLTLVTYKPEFRTHTEALATSTLTRAR